MSIEKIEDDHDLMLDVVIRAMIADYSYTVNLIRDVKLPRLQKQITEMTAKRHQVEEELVALRRKLEQLRDDYVPDIERTRLDIFHRWLTPMSNKMNDQILNTRKTRSQYNHTVVMNNNLEVTYKKMVRREEQDEVVREQAKEEEKRRAIERQQKQAEDESRFAVIRNQIISKRSSIGKSKGMSKLADKHTVYKPGPRCKKNITRTNDDEDYSIVVRSRPGPKCSKHGPKSGGQQHTNRRIRYAHLEKPTWMAHHTFVRSKQTLYNPTTTVSCPGCHQVFKAKRSDSLNKTLYEPAYYVHCVKECERFKDLNLIRKCKLCPQIFINPLSYKLHVSRSHAQNLKPFGGER